MIQCNFKLILLGFFVIYSSSLISQKDIYFNINHLLGNEVFELEKKGKNNLEQEFTLSRFDYYISNIALHHDGNKVTKISDGYLFLQSKKAFSKYLGNYNIDQLDSISFYIGVDSITNHADPSLWPADHALAPKDPDMHWGWAAGYKFFVLEGHNGPDIAYDLQVHAFGDPLLTKVVVPTNGTLIENKLNINLDAHCQKVMDEINLTKVVIVHGSSKDVIRMMKNFKEKFFTSSSTVSKTNEVSNVLLKVYPNPCFSDHIMVELPVENLANATLIIKDIVGNTVFVDSYPKNRNEISLPSKGLYFVEVLRSGKVISKGSLVRL